ncbi:hypothetical protein IMZ29_04780 [Achromobacter sp. GG226]|uniref:heme biosynthesis HemY N-terminal domain-containing protein n=1 Tax=Verticiella alkaliphila TaxID=2779529 RepID=UPI001C0ABBEB|nr:heme biosynthesis HemY N-terminal domain-containing protein [Verticiella sp. GG226]MBU4609883.1 hypothetical protein [Verticiella sp. GG226]
MKTWVWTLLLLIVAVGLAVVARDHAGNVVIIAPPYRIEVSLAFAIAVLVGLFILLHLLLRLAGWTLGVSQRVRLWQQQRELVREHERLEQGWINLLQGHYVRAEQGFGQVALATHHVDRRVLAYLSSARAAHAMQQTDRAEAALQSAASAARNKPPLALAVACTGADIRLAQGRAADALATLEPVRQGGARHVHVQRLLLRIYLALPNWEEALKLARTLSRHRAADMDVNPTIAQAAAQWLRSAGDEPARRAVWKSLKASERTQPEVALAAADVFADDPVFVRKILQTALEPNLDARLLTAYAVCGPEEAGQRLQRAETWLQTHPRHPELLRVLGSLCMQRQLWGPATGYLQRSLQERDDPRTHALLGSLYDRLDKPALASRHWQLATAAVVGLTVLDRDGALPAADILGDPERLALDTTDFEDEALTVPVVIEAPPSTATAEDEDAWGAADLPPRDPDTLSTGDEPDVRPVPGAPTSR